MFSGIVKTIGIVERTKIKEDLMEITISSDLNFNVGDSVSVNGCCQTVIETKNNFFIVQAVQETLDKTNLSELSKGLKVNLEPSLRLGEKIDGHLVSGHIDDTGNVFDIVNDRENQIISVGFPERLKKYISPKGSISVNGVSLTVIDVQNNTFSFTVIPYTRANTNLGLLKKSDLVNLEIDLISRYLVNYLESTKELINK